MKILIGTNNENKLAQFRRIFGNLDPAIEIVSLKELGILDDVEEDGETILENAAKKAKFFAKSGLITLADDLGLFVDALGGDPGLHAKRWHAGTDRARCEKLQERLKGVPQEKRTCQYRSVLVSLDPKTGRTWVYEHALPGQISDEYRGALGFGYDAIFICQDGRHYAEYSDAERDAISHRGLGARAFLKSYFYQNL